jgi:hypothetical protein
MGNLNKMTDIWVIHRGSRKNSKPKLEVFKDIRIDDIIDINKRVPYIPTENEILEIGVGDKFEELFKKKYKIFH